MTGLNDTPTASDVSGLGPLATLTPGTNVATALAVDVGTAGAPVINGGVLGTPTSGSLANCTGLPVTGGGTGVTTIAALARALLASGYIQPNPNFGNL